MAEGDEPTEANAGAAADDAERAADGVAGPTPPADLNTIVMILGTAAAMHLGLVQDEAGAELPTNLTLAKHNIDLLCVLEAKTAGNLTGGEEQILTQVLYDLRVKYVAACEKA